MLTMIMPNILQTASSKRLKGFTLVELMVTISLLALLLFAAVPSFTQWSRNTQIRSAAESLQNGLRLARTQALTSNRQVVFSLHSLQPGLNVAAAATGLNWGIQTVPLIAGETAEFIQGGNFASTVSGLTINSPGPAPAPPATAAVCFNSIGQQVSQATPGTGVACVAAATSFVVSRVNEVAGEDRPLTVTVSLSGQVRMCDPARPSGSPDACP
jgi:type IV fimbrial biogenesis protein FimT